MRVWGEEFTGLSGSTRNNKTLHLFLFIAVVCAFLFCWLQTVAYWRSLNSVDACDVSRAMVAISHFPLYTDTGPG